MLLAAYVKSLYFLLWCRMCFALRARMLGVTVVCSVTVPYHVLSCFRRARVLLVQLIASLWQAWLDYPMKRHAHVLMEAQ